MIHLGDCLEKLKELPGESVEAVITDPPYCSGGFSESQKKSAVGQGLRSKTIKEVGWFANDNMSTLGLIWLLRSAMVECERVMKDGASAMVFTALFRKYGNIGVSKSKVEKESAGLARYKIETETHIVRKGQVFSVSDIVLSSG